MMGYGLLCPSPWKPQCNLRSGLPSVLRFTSTFLATNENSSKFGNHKEGSVLMAAQLKILK